MKKHFELYPVQKPAELFPTPSRKMIKTLRECLQMETSFPGRPYGPTDIRGSLVGLYKRGLLDINTNPENKLTPGSWYVTPKGLQLLLVISEKHAESDSELLNNIYKLKQNVKKLQNSMTNLKRISDNMAI